MAEWRKNYLYGEKVYVKNEKEFYKLFDILHYLGFKWINGDELIGSRVITDVCIYITYDGISKTPFRDEYTKSVEELLKEIKMDVYIVTRSSVIDGEKSNLIMGVYCDKETALNNAKRFALDSLEQFQNESVTLKRTFYESFVIENHFTSHPILMEYLISKHEIIV